MTALSLASLHGVPEETAMRMMCAHGSRNLLLAMRGEPLLPSPLKEPKVIRLPRPAPAPKPPRDRTAAWRKEGVPSRVRETIAAVAEAFGLTPDDISGKCRRKHLVYARSVFYRLLRDVRNSSGQHVYSLPRIATYVGRDHSTVCHGLDHFDIYCKVCPDVRRAYERLRGAE